MNNYTIYCTEAQTKKALELGANIYNMQSNISVNGCNWFDYKGKSYLCPTAEQMIGWLEEQKDIDSISIEKSTIVNERNQWQYSVWDREEMWDCGGHGYNSRKASTLSAIDAALEYLAKRKEE